MDTIFAPATARGKAGVAILRVSGTEAFAALARMVRGVPEPRVASLRTLRAADGRVLDEALILTFEANHSFTGEDTVEFHVHGSLAVLSAVQAELASMPGLRFAEPGEFTRRALENDRLDLTQVEGLADLVNAETEAQRVQAQRVLSGTIGQKVSRWRADLIRAAALIEATIDFADEDVPVDVRPEVLNLLHRVTTEFAQEIAGSAVAERLRDGFQIAIIGKPNVGKSTLLNRLAGRDAAITSPVAGTTRDVIEVRMDLKGLPVTFLDTAGLRETEDEVEAQGVARAISRAMDADVRILLLSNEDEPPTISLLKDDLILVTKDDSGVSEGPSISGVSGHGVDTLLDNLLRILRDRTSGIGSMTNERHRIALSRASSELAMATCRLKAGEEGLEFVAADIRGATTALNGLLGHVDVEDLLDEIFSSFCIGK